MQVSLIDMTDPTNSTNERVDQRQVITAMSGNDFFIFDSTEKESAVDEGATSWLFGGDDGDGENGVRSDSNIGGAGQGGGDGGFDLPLLKGPLFGTDNVEVKSR